MLYKIKDLVDFIESDGLNNPKIKEYIESESALKHSLEDIEILDEMSENIYD